MQSAGQFYFFTIGICLAAMSKNRMTKYNVVIETPRNSREKYTYDEESKGFFLKKLLPAGMCFPYDFGFIPGTKGEDGDPVDALIISEFGTFPGCGIECRLIGALLAEQAEKNQTIRNDRFFFVPCISMVYKHIKSTRDLPKSFMKELLFFFINYNEEKGKEFRVLEVVSRERAKNILKENLKKGS